MNKTLFSLIAFILVACSPQVTVTSDVTTTLPATQQVENTKIVPTPTAKEKTIEEIAQDVINGTLTEPSIMALPEQQRKELSIIVAEMLNQERGDNPIIYNGEAYIHPDTGKMTSVTDGTTPAERTETMYLARYVDDAGYTHIITETGEDVRIENSRGVNWQIFETLEEANEEVTWPTTEKLGPEYGERAGLTVPESLLAKSRVMIPIILLNKDLGEIFLSGGGKIPTQEMQVVVNPLAVGQITTTGIAKLYKEGTDLDLGTPGYLRTHHSIFQAMQENAVYYLIFAQDQKKHFSSTYPVLGGNEPTNDYSGLAKSSSTFGILSGKNKSKDSVWIDIDLLILADN